MAIVRLTKVTLCGTANQRDRVLDGLQDLGCLHLVDISEQASEPLPKTNVSSETHQALKYLRSCPVRRRPMRDRSEFRLTEVVQETLCIERRQEQLLQQRDELAAAIKGLEPWGNFQCPLPSELLDWRLWFYVLPSHRLREIAARDEIWQVVSRDHQNVYLVVVSVAEPQGMPISRVDLDHRPLADLRRELEHVDSELDELHWQRVALTRWIRLLQSSIAQADDQIAWQIAVRRSLGDRSLFAVQGWVPVRAEQQMRSFAQEHDLALMLARPDKHDKPPTLLENPPLTSGGQDAVTFFTIPAYNAWDPSSIVFFSFSLFFAMIMADAGYALLLGVLLLLAWGRLGVSAAGQRIRKLAVSMVLMSLLYGVLIGSYFGRLPAAGTWPGRLMVIDATDTDLMMRISIVVGVLHLVLANLAVAWQLRWSVVMLAALGWAAVLLGGLAFGLGKTSLPENEYLIQSGVGMLWGGTVSVVLFSSSRSLWTWRPSAHFWRLLEGLKALVNVSRAFGDVLSYLRLFALGLATAQLAAAFNELTAKAGSHAGTGGLLAVLVVLFGHGLNLSLAVMSGVVHGLRLNCIEFFGWGLPEEGYPFQPFCRKAK